MHCRLYLHHAEDLLYTSDTRTLYDGSYIHHINSQAVMLTRNLKICSFLATLQTSLQPIFTLSNIFYALWLNDEEDQCSRPGDSVEWNSNLK